MSKCDIKIMATPKRLSNVNLLKFNLCLIDKDVFVDTEYRKNPLWTWCNTMCLPKSDDVTHRLILQDDALVGNNLYEFSNMLVDRYPHAVIVLYNRADKINQINKDSYLFKTSMSFGGVANIVPFEIFDDFYAEYQSDFYNFISDDNALHYWCIKHNYCVIKTYPTVVETTDQESIMGNEPVGHQNKFVKDPLMCKWPIITDKRDDFWVAKLDKKNHTLTS